MLFTVQIVLFIYFKKEGHMDSCSSGEELPSFMTQTDLCGIKWFQVLRNVKANQCCDFHPKANWLTTDARTVSYALFSFRVSQNISIIWASCNC